MIIIGINKKHHIEAASCIFDASNHPDNPDINIIK